MGLFGLSGSMLGSIGLGAVADMANTAFAGHVSRQNARTNAALSLNNWIYQQSNAHQLEVEDLKKAGLNPILSATNSQIASAPSVSGQASPSDGVSSALVQAATNKELKRMDLENKFIEAKIDAAKNGMILKDDGTLERVAADQRFGAETNNIIADTSLKNTNSAYLRSATVNERERTQQEIKESQQRIENSIKEVNALVEKYGAESDAARAAAAKAWNECKLLLEQVTGQQLDNKQMQRILDNPKAELDARTWETVKNGYPLTLIYEAGQFIKSVLPFDSVSVGYRKFSSTETKTSNSNHNYNYNKR